MVTFNDMHTARKKMAIPRKLGETTRGVSGKYRQQFSSRAINTWTGQWSNGKMRNSHNSLARFGFGLSSRVVHVHVELASLLVVVEACLKISNR